jgi:hypothetical protein
MSRLPVMIDIEVWEMSAQTVSNTPLTIEWDDSIVIAFSFDGAAGNRVVCGFVHQVLAVQFVSGSQTQITSVLQQVVQQGIQASLDPQTWVETIKAGARSGGSATVVYDDSVSVTYTTQTNRSFTLQQLFSVTG